MAFCKWANHAIFRGGDDKFHLYELKNILPGSAEIVNLPHSCVSASCVLPLKSVNRHFKKEKKRKPTLVVLKTYTTTNKILSDPKTAHKYDLITRQRAVGLTNPLVGDMDEASTPK